MVAGGGGAANTGVKNGFEVFQVTFSLMTTISQLLSQISSNGENVIGESVTRHFTGEFSVYSMAVRPAGSEAVLSITYKWFMSTLTKDDNRHVLGNNNEPLKVLVAAGHGEFCQVYQLSLQRSVSYRTNLDYEKNILRERRESAQEAGEGLRHRGNGRASGAGVQEQGRR